MYKSDIKTLSQEEIKCVNLKVKTLWSISRNTVRLGITREKRKESENIIFNVRSTILRASTHLTGKQKKLKGRQILDRCL